MSTEVSPLKTPSAATPKTISWSEYSRHLYQLTRLHKFPLGNILIIWPCLWALVMALSYNHAVVPTQHLLVQLFLFSLGSTLLHSAACVLNDICDIDFDAQVERTKTRPLVTGAIPISSAWALLAVLVTACFYMLILTNSTAAFIGIFGVFPFHALYPLMKRWTWWPQAWLGIAMNWGFPVAWLSINPSLDRTEKQLICVMMLGLLCWTIVYDTEYGCQDRKDDAKIGVKSTSLLFGDNVRPILMGFAVIFVGCLVCAGVLSGQSAPYFAVSCGGAAVHLAWQFYTWDPENPADCGAKFKSHQDLGAIVWVGLLLDYAMQRP